MRRDIEMTVAERIQRHYQDHGLVKTLAWFFTKALTSVVNLKTCLLLERTLGPDIPSFPAKIEASFHAVSIHELSAFRGLLKRWEGGEQLLRDRLNRGQTCIGCFHEGYAIGYIWVTTVPERDRNFGLTISPQADESYGFDLFVLPEYRKFVVGYDLISRWLAFSREAGKKRAIGVVATYNKPMLMTLRLVFGFKPTTKVHSLELLGRFGIVVRVETLR